MKIKTEAEIIGMLKERFLIKTDNVIDVGKLFIAIPAIKSVFKNIKDDAEKMRLLTLVTQYMAGTINIKLSADGGFNVYE